MKSEISLCIGAPRSGTTWLYGMLSNSRSIFTPAIKEIRHFYSKRNHQEKLDAYYSRKSESRPDHRIWLDRWINEENTDFQYIDNLTTSSKKPVAMDITPAYSVAPKKIIHHIRSVLGPIKIIYIIRYPIDREYSHMDLEFHLHGDKKFTLPSTEYIKRFDHSLLRQRTDYLENINRWTEVFGEENFLLLNFEEIISEPDTLLRGIYSFLELDYSVEDFSDIITQKFGSQNLNSPGPNSAIKHLLTVKYYNEISRFHDSYPDIGKKWICDAESSIDQFESLMNHPSICKSLYDFELEMISKMVSLGDNSEFGFFQQTAGVEPESLFRWAITPIDTLIEYIESNFEVSIYQANGLSPYSPKMVKDNNSEFCYHSEFLEEDSEGDIKLIDNKIEFFTTLEKESGKVNSLINKFKQQLHEGGNTYVIKNNDYRSLEKIKKLTKLLNSANQNNNVLFVQQAHKNDSSRKVKEIYRNLYVGKITRFAPYTEASNILFSEWLQIIRSYIGLQLKNGSSLK